MAKKKPGRVTGWPTTPPPQNPPPGWWWDGHAWRPPAPPAKPKHSPAAVGFAVLVAIGVAIWLFSQHSSAPSSGDISKIAAVNSDCQNYSTLSKPSQDLCNTEVGAVRDACNGDDLARGAFINYSGLDGGVSEAESELTALCPEKEPK